MKSYLGRVPSETDHGSSIVEATCSPDFGKTVRGRSASNFEKEVFSNAPLKMKRYVHLETLGERKAPTSHFMHWHSMIWKRVKSASSRYNLCEEMRDGSRSSNAQSICAYSFGSSTPLSSQLDCCLCRFIRISSFALLPRFRTHRQLQRRIHGSPSKRFHPLLPLDEKSQDKGEGFSLEVRGVAYIEHAPFKSRSSINRYLSNLSSRRVGASRQVQKRGSYSLVLDILGLEPVDLTSTLTWHGE